ncbi:MAG: DUF4012 domain-containing protein [Acidimicrobiales bacterium]
MAATVMAIAALSWFAYHARRWTLAVPGVVALALASSVNAGIVAAVALLCAVGVRLIDRDPRLCALVGGLVGLALAGMRDVSFTGSSALVAIVAAAPVVVSGYTHARRPVRKSMRWTIAGAAAATAVLLVLVAIALLGVTTDTDDGIAGARRGLDAARAGDRDLAIAELRQATDALTSANDRLGVIWLAPARHIPIVGPHLDAASDLTAVGAEVAAAAGDAADKADLDTLRASGGRIDLDVVRSMQPPIERLVSSLEHAQRTVAAIDSAWLVPLIRDELEVLAVELEEQMPDARRARDGLQLLPGLLGADGERRYLMLFGTTSEAREAGGLLGNFVEVVARDGAIDLGIAARATDLNAFEGDGVLTDPMSYPPLFIGATPWTAAQDWTRLVDFPTMARAVGELYPTMGGRPVDGVGYLDPTAVAALMRFTGPIELEELGRTLTADNVEDFLLREQYEDFDDAEDPGQAERKDFLTDLSADAFEVFLEIDLPSPTELGDVLGPPVRQGHMLFTSFDPAEAAFLADVGVHGAFPQAEGGDLLSVVHVNKSSDKLDAYTLRSAAYSATLTPASDGRWTVDATAEVRFGNGVEPEGLPAYVLGPGSNRPVPPGVNLAEMSVYTPWDLVDISVDGSPVLDAATYDEFGAQRHVTTVGIGPGEERVITYRLRGEWVGDPADYALQLASQPLVHDAPLSVSVTADGQTLLDTELNLDEDYLLEQDNATTG